MTDHAKKSWPSMRDFMDIVERGDGKKIFWTTIVVLGVVYTVSAIQSRDWQHS